MPYLESLLTGEHRLSYIHVMAGIYVAAMVSA